MDPTRCTSLSAGPSSLRDWILQRHVVNAIHLVRRISNTTGLLFHEGYLILRSFVVQHVLDSAKDGWILSTVTPSINTCSFGHQGLMLVLASPWYRVAQPVKGPSLSFPLVFLKARGPPIQCWEVISFITCHDVVTRALDPEVYHGVLILLPV